jgi:superfamily II DNA or RNA helicase
MLKLRPFQKEAADFLLSAMSEGSALTFKSPIASGRTLIVIDAAKRVPGKVAIVSRHRLIREQYRAMAEKSGATNISVSDTRLDPAAFLAVILDSETDKIVADQTPVVTLGHL